MNKLTSASSLLSFLPPVQWLSGYKVSWLKADLLAGVTLAAYAVRHVHGTPLILVGKMWNGLLDWAKSQLLTTDPPLANPEDMTIPICVNTADEAIALIREHHVRWLKEQKN